MLISVNGFSQVTILDSTNLNGFTHIGPETLLKYPDRVEFRSSTSFNNAQLDTTLNLTGYDSIKVSFYAWKYAIYYIAGSAFVNNFSVLGGSNIEYNYVTSNTSVLSLHCTLVVPGGGVDYLVIKKLKIVGYPTVTAIKENQLTNNNDFIYYSNNLIHNGDINKQQLTVSDLYGKTIISKNLEKNELFRLGTRLLYDKSINGRQGAIFKKNSFRRLSRLRAESLCLTLHGRNCIND